MTEYYSFATEYGMKDELFRAIMSSDKPRVETLQKLSVTLTEDVKRTLVKGGGSYFSNDPADKFWYQYLRDIERKDSKSFIWMSRKFFEETKAPLYYSWVLEQRVISGRSLNNAMLACLLECYDFKKLFEARIFRAIIENDNAELLSLCAERGRLKKLRVCDEMIQYATEKGKRDCLAWLLDFENRNFDLAAERAKAEKKAEREFNAAPNSMTALKAVWRFRKREDGTIIITRYIGDRTEVSVPERIGKYPVTAIGKYAFSPKEIYTTDDIHECQSTITKITLPNGIQSIGKGAFFACGNLTEMVIPDSVREINYGIFEWCTSLRFVKLPEGITEINPQMFWFCTALEKITIPRSVVKIGNLAFFKCDRLEEIVLPEGVEEIGQQAFKNCNSLKTVVLPASVRRIRNRHCENEPPRHIFYDCLYVTAVVEPKSYAEKYCQRNEINFVYKESV